MTRILALLIATLLMGCSALPSLEGRSPSSALEGTSGTRLGRAIAPLAAAHPAKNGIYPVSVPGEAFAARVLLAETAEKSLDVQYYIWHGERAVGGLGQQAARGEGVERLVEDVDAALRRMRG